jgi:tetratricopeptide (TPR) repeat protein
VPQCAVIKMEQPVFAPSDPLEVLRQVHLTPRLLEDYRPVAECLEWRLSQNHWRNTGTASFTKSEVPYTITSSGTLSAQAACVLFANCIEAPPSGKIPVLETGAGTGMFAKLFLDEFERLCSNSGHPFASQILYHVTDGSLEAVEQWKRLGIFAGKNVVLGTAQGGSPLAVTIDGEQIRLSGLRAVFANYVIDSLDSAVLRQSPNGPEELHIRTHFSAQPETSKKHLDIGLEKVQKMVSKTDPELLRFLDVLEFEAAFLPVSRPYPCMEETLAFGHDWPRVTLNFGAMEYLERVIEGLDSNGFVLVNDYGLTQPSESNSLGCVQRFGPTAAIGINFPLMAHHFSSRGLRVSRPALDERLPLHPMLLNRRELAETERKFQETFGWECHREMNAPSQLARQHLETGRIEQAGRAYEQALLARPRDWSLMGEIAEFLLRHVEDYEAGRKMAETALSMNPWYSVWLWNLLGDALYALNRFSDAHEIYLKAQSLSSDDIRTALNLGYTYWELGSPAQALQALARGLAADGSGQFRDRLLEKQGQILAGISQRFGREQEWLARRTARMTAG